MRITCYCPECDVEFEIAQEFARRKVRCPICSASIVAPVAEEPKDIPPEANADITMPEVEAEPAQQHRGENREEKLPPPKPRRAPKRKTPAQSIMRGLSQISSFSPVQHVMENAKRPRRAAAILLASGSGVMVLLFFGVLWLWPGGDPCLQFDWPTGERDDAKLVIDEQSYDVEKTGSLQHRCKPGEHRIVATRPDFEPFVETVSLEAGETRIIHPVWKPRKKGETALAFEWPENEREGAILEIDGKPIDVVPDVFLKQICTPGAHQVVGTRPWHETYREVVMVEEEETKIIRPVWRPFTSLVFEWPEEDRANASVELNGNTKEVAASGPVRLQCEAGELEIVARRPGFKPFATSLMIMDNQVRVIRPVWKLLPPTLIAPEAAAVLKNGNRDGSKTRVWDFKWSPVAKAAKYQLVVFAPGSSTPVLVKADITSASYRDVSKDHAPNQNLRGWRWKVRAFAEDSWTDWSEEGTFDVEPLVKHSMPSKAEQAIVANDWADAFRIDENAKAREKAQLKLALAKKLLSGSNSIKDPVERFVVLRKAVVLAEEGGDADLMIRAVDSIDLDFEIDVVDVKAKTLTALAENARSSASLSSLVRQYKPVVDQAAAGDRYELALNLAKLVHLTCQRPNGGRLRIETRDCLLVAEEMHGKWDKVKNAKSTLAADADNAEANLVLGNWLCFNKGQWPEGLPHLAKGNDRYLRTLAKSELAAPSQPKEQMRLANTWLDMAKDRKLAKSVRDAALVRAVLWFRQVEESGQSNEAGKDAERRLGEIETLVADMRGPTADQLREDLASRFVFQLKPQRESAGVSIGLGNVGRLVLSSQPRERLRGEPRYRSSRPMYGTMNLGVGTDTRITFVLDQPANGSPILYVDRDNDEDLSNDGPQTWNNVSERTAAVFNVVVDVEYPDGRMPCAVSFFRTRNDDGNSIRYYTKGIRTGELRSMGKTYKIAVVGRNSDGCFDNTKGGVLFIDLNRDGQLATNKDSAEYHDLDAPFNIHGKVWQIDSLSKSGSLLKIKPSNASVAMNTYFEPGYPAPSFTALGLDGRAIDLKLEAARTKYVLLEFWGDWCPYCHGQYPTMRRLNARYRSYQLRLIGINCDSDREAAARVVREQQLNYPHVYNGRDFSSEVFKKYRVDGIPDTFLLDSNLKIIAMGLRGEALENRIRELLGDGG